jgi:sulfite exporter TauE/SafE
MASRVVYNSGRITAYAILGVAFGLVGKSLVVAGFQQWLSITAGFAMLGFVVFGHKRLGSSGWRAAGWIKSTFRTFLQRRTFPAVFGLGAANGLLPCGLVYLAGTAAAASGDVAGAVLYMLMFGFGTIPMMLGIGLFGVSFMKLLQRFGLKPLVPVSVCLVALTLILRGAGLDIPYFSPAVSNGRVTCSGCPK